MNEVDAVSPQFYESLRDISDFLAEFGPYNGRYVANYPANWESQFLEQLSDLSTMDQKKAKELLNRYKIDGIQATLIEKNLSFNNLVSWSKNVENLQKENAFNDVVAGTYDDDGVFKKWSEKILDLQANRSRNTLVRGSADENISIIEPLLRKGPAAYFIDPYFRPNDDPSINFIKRLFHKVFNSDCYQIAFYIRKSHALPKEKNGDDCYTLDEYKDKLIDIYQGSQSIPKNRSLTFHLVDEVSEKNLTQDDTRLHNRFFLTKYGAIDFGKGFSPLSHKTAQIPVYLVERGPHLELVNLFISDKANFKSKDSITLKSNK